MVKEVEKERRKILRIRSWKFAAFRIIAGIREGRSDHQRVLVLVVIAEEGYGSVMCFLRAVDWLQSCRIEFLCEEFSCVKVF